MAIDIVKNSIGKTIDTLVACDGDASVWKEFICELDEFGKQCSYGLGWKVMVISVIFQEELKGVSEEFENYLKIVEIREGVRWWDM